jgi:hypothetical protein
MVIHIALIGRNPEHIWDGLKELSPVEKLYLLHSPSTPKDNFVEIARGAKEEIQKNFCNTILVKINAFDMISVWNTIDKIVTDEMNEDAMLSPRDFAINVTGGTNLMAAASTVAAILTGCKAYYVYDRRREKGRKKYIEELPIPPINILRSLSNSHQKILRAISNSIFEYKGQKQNGVIQNKILREKLNLRPSTLNSSIKELKKRGYIETQRGVPKLRSKQIGPDQQPIQIEVILENEMLISITQLGLIQSKKAAYSEETYYE